MRAIRRVRMLLPTPRVAPCLTTMPGLLPDIPMTRWLARILGGLHRPRAQPHVQTLYRRDAGHSGTLKEVYHAHTAVLVPGSGTFGMEAVARQFANKEKC